MTEIVPAASIIIIIIIIIIVVVIIIIIIIIISQYATHCTGCRRYFNTCVIHDSTVMRLVALLHLRVSCIIY